MAKAHLSTASAEQTRDLGRRAAEILDGGENLLLVGDLGAGKTMFVQGLAEGLGVTEPVKSPTYTYLKEYQLPLRSTRLAHFDLYRLPEQPSERDLTSIELPERLADADVITVIEWGDRLTEPGQPAETIRFEIGDGDARRIELPPKLRGLS